MTVDWQGKVENHFHVCFLVWFLYLQKYGLINESWRFTLILKSKRKKLTGLRKFRVIWRLNMWKKLAGVLQLTTWNSEKHFLINFNIFFVFKTKANNQVHNLHLKKHSMFISILKHGYTVYQNTVEANYTKKSTTFVQKCKYFFPVIKCHIIKCKYCLFVLFSRATVL